MLESQTPMPVRILLYAIESHSASQAVGVVCRATTRHYICKIWYSNAKHRKVRGIHTATDTGRQNVAGAPHDVIYATLVLAGNETSISATNGEPYCWITPVSSTHVPQEQAWRQRTFARGPYQSGQRTRRYPDFRGGR